MAVSTWSTAWPAPGTGSRAVTWWRTLHQDGTVFNRNLDVQISGTMAWTLLWGVVAFTLLYAYLVLKRNDLAELLRRKLRG